MEHHDILQNFSFLLKKNKYGASLKQKGIVE